MSTNSGHADQILKAIMLSATFTSMEPVVFDHVNGTTGTWTHDDYDAAHAQLHALLAEVEELRLLVEAADEHARQPIDLNYIAVPKDAWEDITRAVRG